MGLKICRVWKKIVGPKICDPNCFGFRIRKKKLGKKNWGLKNILGSKQICAWKNLCSNKVQKKMYPKPSDKVFRPSWSLNKLSFWGWGVVGLFLSLREIYIPNLSLLLSLESFEKVPGRWWWYLNPTWE